MFDFLWLTGNKSINLEEIFKSIFRKEYINFIEFANHNEILDKSEKFIILESGIGSDLDGLIESLYWEKVRFNFNNLPVILIGFWDKKYLEKQRVMKVFFEYPNNHSYINFFELPKELIEIIPELKPVVSVPELIKKYNKKNFVLYVEHKCENLSYSHLKTKETEEKIKDYLNKLKEIDEKSAKSLEKKYLKK